METITSKNDPLIGKKLGDYHITGVLASGGMAKIYIGRDEKLEREAAVKVLTRAMLDSDPTLSERFTREARAVAKLDHDNIVPIYQYGEQDDVYFLVMKLIVGRDLADEINDLQRLGQTMSLPRMFHLLKQVAAALDFAHKNGIIHRDVKPSNVLIDKNDRAYLTDFGLVLRQDIDMTRGTAFGTPRYISPEQALASERAVPQSDTYSLAVIVYEILTGSIMFKGDTAMQVALSHISEAPPLPSAINASIPKSVERELLKALEKEPEKRHPKATDFIRALESAYGDLLIKVTSATNDTTIVDRPTDFPTKEDAKNKPEEAILSAWDTPSSDPIPATSPKAKGKAKAKTSDAPKPKVTPTPPVATTPTPTPIESAIPKVEAIPPVVISPDSLNKKPVSSKKLPIPLLAGIGGFVLVVIIGIIILSGGGNSASNNTVVNNSDGEPVMVYYQTNILAIRNMSDVTLDLSSFQLGDSTGVIRASDIRGGILNSGECVVVKNQNQSTNPPSAWGCTTIRSEILRASNALAWRNNFQVKSGNAVIANCNAVAGGATAECSFSWSVIKEQ
ncbi:MAG: serine/threonine-protein kinase [bacterium]|nr:serine/threonine-protein kinase [bacterium]